MYNKRSTKRRQYKGVTILLLVSLSLLVFGLFYLQLIDMQDDFEKDYTNVNISCKDYSLGKDNPSLKLTIDGIEVLLLDSINSTVSPSQKIHLKKGKYPVTLSTVDGRHFLTDSLWIQEYPLAYEMELAYYHKPPVDEYKQLLIDYVYQKSIKKHSYTAEQQELLRKKVQEEITADLANDTSYQEKAPHFTIHLYSHKTIQIE